MYELFSDNQLGLIPSLLLHLHIITLQFNFLPPSILLT